MAGRGWERERERVRLTGKNQFVVGAGSNVERCRPGFIAYIYVHDVCIDVLSHGLPAHLYTAGIIAAQDATVMCRNSRDECLRFLIVFREGNKMCRSPRKYNLIFSGIFLGRKRILLESRGRYSKHDILHNLGEFDLLRLGYRSCSRQKFLLVREPSASSKRVPLDSKEETN